MHRGTELRGEVGRASVRCAQMSQASSAQMSRLVQKKRWDVVWSAHASMSRSVLCSVCGIYFQAVSRSQSRQLLKTESTVWICNSCAFGFDVLRVSHRFSTLFFRQWHHSLGHRDPNNAALHFVQHGSDVRFFVS